MSYIDGVDHLNRQLTSLKNSRNAFIGHVTRLRNKIHEAIENLEKVFMFGLATSCYIQKFERHYF